MESYLIEQYVEKVYQAVEEMTASREASFLKKMVSVTDRLSISVECERVEHGRIADEEGKLVSDSTGEVIQFEIYAVKDGKDIDCCTVLPGDRKTKEDIRYLINCYQD